ncbi:MAG: alpha/beta hydrolase [Anaerolineae bacterium]
MSVPVEFTSGGCRVRGRWHRGTGMAPFPTLLLLPGFPGSGDDVLELGHRISSHGVNVLTFAYRGTYESEGSYSLRATLEDIGAAIAYLRQEEAVDRFQMKPGSLVLGGWSYGGGMALTYAANRPDVRRVASIAGTDHAELAREYRRNAAFAEMLDATFKALESPKGPVRFDGKAALEELAQDPAPYDLRLSAPALADRDILLIGAWDDSYVTIEHHVLPFYRALEDTDAQHVRIIAFQDNHAFESSREGLAAAIVSWVLSR